jgi:hypothetical protein
MSLCAKWHRFARPHERSSSEPGVGEQKLKDFAEPFTAAIADYVASGVPKV